MHHLFSFALLLTALHLQAQLPSFQSGHKTWAVIAGISDYQHKEITDLQFAHRDAQAFHDFLASPAGGKVPAEQIQLLINEDATMARFAAALDWLIENAGEGDQVYIYFAGHGDVENKTIGQHGFLLPWDAPSRSYIAGAYPLFYLQSVISTLSVQKKARVIMVADACHSGKLAGTSIQGNQITAANLQQQYANEVKVLACGPDEFSVEGEQWGGGRGAFSYHLVDGLSGLADRDGNFEVNLFELRRYLEDLVPAETAPNSQYPITIGDRNTPIALVDPPTLALLKDNKSGQHVPFDMVATRGMETLALAQSDSLGQEIYEAFQKALLEKRLLSPENSSAWYYYQQLSQRPEFAKMDGALRRNLAVALQDEAQQTINAYLDTDPQELAKRWKEGENAYSSIPGYLSKSAELLGADHYMVPSIRSKQFYFEAMLLRMRGDSLDTAMEKIAEAIRLEPKGAHLYNELGMIYDGLDDPDKEQKAYRQAHALAPAWVMPVHNLSYLKREQGDLDSALYWVNLAISLKPGFASTHFHLGSIQYEKGDLDAAEAAFLRSIDLCRASAANDPDFPEMFYNLGNIYLRTNRPEEAVKAYREAVRLHPTHPYAHYGLGVSLKRTGQQAEAVEAYRKNIEITPEYLEPYYAIALVYAGNHEDETALAWLEKLLEKGYSNQARIMKEEGFKNLRDTEAFRQLQQRYFAE